MVFTRALWSLFAVSLLIVCVVLGITQGWWATGILTAAAMLPDVALIGAFASDGKLRPDRVRFYNALHMVLPAITIVIFGALLMLTINSPVAMLVGLAWLTHISVDRACGFGLRERDGSIRPVGATRKAHQ